MKIKTFFATAALSLGVLSCATAKMSAYTVTVPLSADEDGVKAYITDYDNGSKIDSTVVDNGKAVFKGTLAGDPVLARVIVDGNRAGVFILEEGVIDMVDGEATGTELNARLKAALDKMDALVAEYRSLPDTPEGRKRAEEIADEYKLLPGKILAENPDNPVGAFIFLQMAYEMNLQELRDNMKRYPAFAGMVKIKGVERNLEVREETSVGHQYKDFEIAYNGKTERLSDYVGKDGKYTLVDFWASWCGPCMREIEVLKELYGEYKDKGLNIVGVAVWDEPENTERAIVDKNIPWPSIINAQNIPTDLYGISGIPCIILIDPQGKIVSRDKQGDDLKADVAAALEGWKPVE